MRSICISKLFLNGVCVFPAFSRSPFARVCLASITEPFQAIASEGDTKADIVVVGQAKDNADGRSLGTRPLMHGNGRTIMMATVTPLILAGAIPAVTDAPQIALLT